MIPIGNRAIGSGASATTREVPLTVCVQHHPRGCWEVITTDGRGRIPCETLEDARRIAYLAVAHAQGCELIVRDADHRVIEHELLEGHPRPLRASR